MLPLSAARLPANPGLLLELPLATVIAPDAHNSTVPVTMRSCLITYRNAPQVVGILTERQSHPSPDHIAAVVGLDRKKIDKTA
jgi:hypothetical protein